MRKTNFRNAYFAGVLLPEPLSTTIHAIAERDNATLASTMRRLLSAAIRFELGDADVTTKR